MERFFARRLGPILPMILMGCSASGANAAPTPPSSAVFRDCRGSIEPTDKRLPPLPVIEPMPSEYTLGLSGMFLLRGRCARYVSAYNNGAVRFGSGYAGSAGIIGKIRVVEVSYRPAPVLLANPPRIAGALPINAIRIDAVHRTDLAYDVYIGVWKTARGWTVARFTNAPGPPESLSRPLIHSKLPLGGLGHLPAVDAAGGTIGLYQRIGPDSVRLLDYGYGGGLLTM